MWHDRYYNKVKVDYSKYVNVMMTKTMVGLLEQVSVGKERLGLALDKQRSNLKCKAWLALLNNVD